MGRIFSALVTRCRRAVARDGHATVFGTSSIFMQQQNDTFGKLHQRFEDDIEFNLLLNAYANGRAMIFVNAVAAIAVGFYLYPSKPGYAVGWVVAILLLSLIRRIKWQHFYDAVHANIEPGTNGSLEDADTRLAFIRKWRFRFAAGLITAGLLWSFILERSIAAGVDSKYFTCIVIAGLAGGAASICAPLKGEGRAYISSLLLPSAVILAIGPNSDPLLAFMAVVCWSTLLFGLSNNHRVHRQALELQATNSGLVRELTDLNQSLEKKVAKRTRDLEYAAMRDPLTDLPNRRGFRTVTNHILRSSRDFTIGVIDLDGFKPVNDAFGHATGDQLLIEVGKRLKTMVGSIFYVARLGGDEFGFILKNRIDPDDLEAFGNALVERLSQPYELTGVVAEIGASVGLSRAPIDGSDAEQLCQRADYALYFAKQFHKGTAVLFEPEHEVEICQLARVEQLLRRADLSKEMYVEFQPITDIRLGHTHAFEALARWQSPELGPVAPNLFIQAAERSGFIVELTRQLVRRTLQHAHSWPKHMRVSINLSARDIASMDAVDALIRIVRESLIDPRRIDFEITETALVCDFDQARAALTKFAALGARIALDDFGTGHSSLSHLQLLPLDKLKIDSSFIANMETDRASQDIIRALILLCRSMKIDCILEGVETESQLKMVRDMGGRLVQGFHIARPMSIGDVTAYITDEQQRTNRTASANRAADRPAWRRRA